MQILLEAAAWIGILLLGGALILRFAGEMSWFPKGWEARLPKGLRSGGPRALALPPARVQVFRVFLFSLVLRLIMVGIGLLCLNLLRDGVSLPGALEQMQSWDSRHYVELVKQGYEGYMENGQHLFLVFFPLYVWLTRAVSLLVPSVTIAGMLVSALCFSFGCCFLYKLAFVRYGQRIARDAVLLLSIFPFSFFFGMVMTESLFFLTITAACYYAQQRRWLLFGIWGALAAMTRMMGLLVILVAATELVSACFSGKKLREGIAPALKKLPLIAMPLSGSLAYLGLNYRVDGDPFAFLRHQQHWFQEFMWAPRALDNMVSSMASGSYRAEMTAGVWLPQIFLFFLFLIILFLSLNNKKNSTGLLLFGLAYLVGNYSLSWLLSGGRYLSCGIVFFLFAAALLQKKPRLRPVVFGAEGVLLGIYFFAALNGAQIM